MNKDEIKNILNEMIDSADGVLDFSMNNEIEEIDRSTLDEKYIERRPTGAKNIYLTIYKDED